jgi:sugar lactone lactonase YvrE
MRKGLTMVAGWARRQEAGPDAAGAAKAPKGTQMKLKLVLLVTLVAGAPLWAVQTGVWQVSTFNQFIKGRLSAVSLSDDGELRLAPVPQLVFNPEQALVLSLAADRNHNLYLGTGHQGKVFRVASDGKSSLFFTAPEPDVFALAVGPDGAVYVGTSPEGKIYRVTAKGKSSVFYNPNAKYIWALAFDSKGRLYAGTGDKGQIFRINPDGQGKVFFTSNQTHIMCLAFDSKGNLLAGSDPGGLIYRITPRGKGFVIYQSNLPEIHELASDAQGNIYAAALGTGGPPGILGVPTPGVPGMPLPAQTMTVTVTGATSPGGAEAASGVKAQKAAPAKPQTSPSFIHAGPSAGMPMAFKPQSRGAVIQISPDSTAQAIWTSQSASPYGLAVRGSQVLFSTDSKGKIYELKPSKYGQELTLLAETREAMATRLLLQGSDLYVATSNVGKLFRLGSASGEQGTYLSTIKDTEFISHWGVIVWRGSFPAGSSIAFYARSGNSPRPDPTWSDWTGPYHDPNGSQLECPPARYLQWKAVLSRGAGSGPRLDEVSVSYLNENLPPQIRSVSVSTASQRTSPAAGPASGLNPAATVSVVGGAFSFAAPATEETSPGTKVPLTLSWQATDPNNDQMVYSVYIRSTKERQWHLLKARLEQPSYTIPPYALADGEYVARIVASDSPSNPAGMARRAAMLSAPFWVDNAPPTIRVIQRTLTGSKAVVRLQAEDAISPLRSAEYKLDSGHWKDILSDDGIVDSRKESFTLRLSGLKPGEHVLLLRATDSAGNCGIGQALLEVSGSGRAEP